MQWRKRVKAVVIEVSGVYYAFPSMPHIVDGDITDIRRRIGCTTDGLYECVRGL